MRIHSICQTGNGDPPPKKPPSKEQPDNPARRQSDVPAESDEGDAT